MIRYFAEHRTAGNLLMLVIVVLGLYGAWTMRRETFPHFASDLVAVDMTYPGAAAAEIEENLVFKIEDAVDGIDGIAEISSIVRDGWCTVRAKVLDGYDARAVQLDVQNALDRIDTFPKDADEPLVYELKQRDRVLSLAVHGEGDPKQLQRVAESIKDELVASSLISLASIEGFSEHQIRIELTQEALLQWGLSIGDIADAVAAGSVDMPVGSVENAAGKTSIRVTDQSRQVEDFKRIVVVASRQGGMIHLGDVARVTDTYEENDRFLRVDGQRAAVIHIDATETEDSLQIADEVQRLVARVSEQGMLPPGVEVTTWGNLADDVRGRLDLLIDNGLIGFVLVLITLALFLDIRLAFWVAIGIPVSFLGTLFVMQWMGHTLNMITMFSLVLALGIIVDDAIVLSENIYVHYRNGVGALRAAVLGVREVWVGVVASMLTTVAAFLPLLFMTGDIGKTLRVMPVGVTLALVISLAEGFLILPGHVRHSLASGDGQQTTRMRGLLDGVLERVLQRCYRPALVWSLNHRYTVIAGAMSLLLVTGAYVASGRLEFTPFPRLDGNVIQAQVILPAGTHISVAERVAGRLEEGLTAIKTDPAFRQRDGQPVVRHVMVQFGSIPSAGVGAVEAEESGSHVLTVVAELLRSEDRHHTAEQIIGAWRSFTIDIPEVVSIRYQQQQIDPGGKPVEVELSGANLDDIKAAALALQQRLTTIPGLSDPDDNLRKGTYEARIRLRESARPLGITSADLAEQLRAAFHGRTAQEYQRGRDTVQVRVVYDDADRRSEADLRDFRLVLSNGRLVPLQEIAEIEMGRGYSQIQRKDRRRTVTVTAELDERINNAAKIAANLREQVLPEIEQQHRVSAEIAGQVAEAQETANSIRFGFLVAVALIYFLLAWVFASYTLPLLVMAAIPLGFVGAVLGHVVMGFDLTMPSLVGLVSLSGIVVNDSVILLQTLRRNLAKGERLIDATHLAGVRRFRAVVLTSLTTIAGLLPMLLETSLQAQFLVPVAISVCFGLLFVTLLVLLLIPCLYLAWCDGCRLLGMETSPVQERHEAGQAAEWEPQEQRAA